ncbi:MAG TPA: sugar ABC transporter permease [Spirochaetia bacterium]|jgi:ABC-type sugar transport system permease subunit|nr:sugar ABC transporter permease [Spirochaetia bacterium]
MRKDKAPLSLILPGLVFVLVFTLYPTVYSLWLSFTDKMLTGGKTSFIGFRNYAELIERAEFWNSLRVTLVYVIVTIFFQIVLGLSLALLTDKKRIGRKLLRTVVLITWVIPEVVVSLTFQWMFLGDKYGLINALLLYLGIINESLKWLSEPQLTLVVAIGMTVWRGVAFSMIMQMAALQSVPETLYEAADIDGASYFQKLFRITIPNISSTILINLIIITIATFNVMSLIYAFSGGGPVGATEVISIYMYKSAFKEFRFGFASSISIIMFLINILFTSVYIRVTKKEFIT